MRVQPGYVYVPLILAINGDWCKLPFKEFHHFFSKWIALQTRGEFYNPKQFSFACCQPTHSLLGLPSFNVTFLATFFPSFPIILNQHYDISIDCYFLYTLLFLWIGAACLTGDKLRRRLSLLSSILHLNSQSVQELGSIHSAAIIGVVPKIASS